MKMRGVKFTWKTGQVGTDVKTKHDIGFIAQEIENVFPELIYKNENGESSFLRLKYDEIVAICLEAIKEQSLFLENSESKIENLEKRLKEKGLV